MSINLTRLLEIMARLRDAESGCPWDVAQTFTTIAPYTIEEAYEVADAIDRNDFIGLRDELGDLLLQVVFHARMAEERLLFDFDQVAAAICDKLVRRHPHVFGDADPRDAARQGLSWDEIKAAERRSGTPPGAEEASVLDDIPVGMPALSRALKLQRRAAVVGFDWPDARSVLDKIAEETEELAKELENGGEEDRLADELGDILFTVVNFCRKVGQDPEAVLRQANAKFERRFRRLETLLGAAGSTAAEATLADLDHLWERVKREE